nr:MAG: maturation protein [Sanya fiers-like virus 47]
MASCRYPAGNILTDSSGPASAFIANPRVPNEPTPDWLALDQKLRAKIKAEKVNVLNMLAEYKQTAQLFTELAQDVLKTYRSFRKGRAFSDFVRMMQRPRTKKEKAIANRVLQYNFGISPLMSDVHEAAAALLSRLQLGTYRYVEARQSQTRYHKHAGAEGVEGYSEVVLKAKARARYRVDYKLLADLKSYGITNPAATLWEITPWSFVVDWVIGVGDFLDQLDATLGISDLRVHRGYRKTWTFSQSGLRNDPGGRMWSVMPTVLGFETTTERTSSGTLGINYPRFKKDPFKLNRLVNSLSLYSQRRK